MNDRSLRLRLLVCRRLEVRHEELHVVPRALHAPGMVTQDPDDLGSVNFTFLLQEGCEEEASVDGVNRKIQRRPDVWQSLG